MSDMLKGFVEQELHNQVKTNYPHIQYPASVYAEITHIKEENNIYRCNLKILDKNKQLDSRFPEIPQVNTTLKVSSGDVVVVLLLYGECIPYIIGKE